MVQDNRSADWFRSFVWIGILANLFFAIPALIFPHVLNEWLGFAPEQNTVWLRNAGLLLVLLNLLYMPAASDPFRYSVYARLTVAARFIAAAFFLWIIYFVPHSGNVRILFWTDLTLGLVMGWTLRRAYHLDTSRAYIMRRSFVSRFFGGLWRFCNHTLGIRWFRLQRYLGAFNLWAVRSDLREHNLHDTGNLPKQQVPPPPPPANHLRHRTADGSHNDLAHPSMGMTGARFARNAPHDKAWPDRDRLLTPSPREVSLRLMTRDEFRPATSLNLLAAAWIQFMNHGWFNHARNEQKMIDIPLAAGDSWTDGEGKPQMQVPETQLDPTRPPNSQALPTYLNTESHWWDGSQLYGSILAQQLRLRSMVDGKVRLDEQGWLPIDDDPKHQGHPFELTGFNDNWWVGLSLLHLLFAKEHNAICEMLKTENPTWDDDRLFNVARLVNSALMAKIHTVEWTPGILAHPTLRVSMDANWWGLLGKALRLRIGRIGKNEALSGIPGSPAEHHTAPFAMTEEFVSVYRLHPLIPDQIRFYNSDNHAEIQTVSFTDSQGKVARPLMQQLCAARGGNQVDLFYSLGLNNPGAITLHNFPAALQNFERATGEKFDLAAVDILRDRERGVPRYNDFREMVRMPRVKSFDELTANSQWAREIADVYNDDIDQVDLLVGLLAEPLPPGFGFSDTAFRIFILMASRRLKSDRFFTEYWNDETYTKQGMAWINNNDMISVLLRHQPELKKSLHGVSNGFAPWNRAT